MIVTVANHKGGVGKTTTAVTLAAVVTRCDPGTVAVLDLDAPTAGKAAGAAQAYRRAHAMGLPAFTADSVPAPLPSGLHLLIDTPPDLAAGAVIEAIQAADVVLVPSGVAADEIDVTAAGVAEIAGYGARRVVIVLTRVPHYAGRAADSATASLRLWLKDEGIEGVTVAEARIPASAAFAQAADAGDTVASGRRTSWRRAARAYESLARETGLINE